MTDHKRDFTPEERAHTEKEQTEEFARAGVYVAQLLAEALVASEAEVLRLQERNADLEERIYAQADEIVQLVKDTGKAG